MNELLSTHNDQDEGIGWMCYLLMWPILWIMLPFWCILVLFNLDVPAFFLIPTRDGQCLYWEAYPHSCMLRSVWHRAILCPCLCMQLLGLHLWFIFFVIPDDGHNCDMVMMLLSVELCQSYIIGLINFVHTVLTLSTILKFLIVLLLSMNDGGVMLLLVLSENLGPVFSEI